MSRSKTLVVLGVMLSIFLAAMEATVVATAMPTIVGQLGGLSIYSWVFSGYLVASTTTVPIFGKLSDLFGRRPVYAIAMALFLSGSLLCGLAESMTQLVVFRVVQGLGAGGVLPLAFTIIGVLFGYEQRACMQGFFAGVWGVSSIIGPLLGGFLVDQISWRWIFYANVAPGILAAALIWFFFVDDPRAQESRPVPVDYLGAGVLTFGVVALLLGLFGLRTPAGWVLLALAAGSFMLLSRVERRAADPVLPLPLFRDRLFSVATVHGFLSGCALFGGLAFVPLFVQGVLRTSATAAGATLSPLMLGWVAASITGSRLMLRIGFRILAVTGMTCLAVGTLLMSQIGVQIGQHALMAYLALMGVGMGLSVPSLMIAVQTAVSRRDLGTATSTLQFSRSIGGALGVSVMGVVLGLRIAATLRAAGVDPSTVSLNRLVDPLARMSAAAGLDGTLRAALADGVRGVFVVAFIAAALGLAVTVMAPGGRLSHIAARRADLDAAARAEEHRIRLVGDETPVA
ncbi:MAG: MDR family MFS transporter [Armatimonadota bacterium]